MDLLWALIIAFTLVGDPEPRVWKDSPYLFPSEQLCEEKLMTYLDDGYVVSKEVSGRLSASKKVRFGPGYNHFYASCVGLMEPD